MTSFAKGAEMMTDRERIEAVGFTEEEADCWELAAALAGKFFALPPVHSSEFARNQKEMANHEVAHTMHVIQDKLLARPAYRQYLKLADGGTSVTT
jgi:hypothetical protein